MSNRIVWDHSSYSVGDDQIDEQHKRIVELINQLTDEFANAQDSKLLESVFGELVEYSANHLAYEEKLLEEVGYPHLEEHKALHWTYLEQISNLSEFTFRNQDKAAEQITVFLKQWWDHHILEEDTDYVPYVKKIEEKCRE